jgi:23S rRNA (cytidine1920-2'-O)/16S rRNA (cytidine1409-2'-O)-methyltransferase
MAGTVLINDEKIEKPGQRVNVDSDIRIKGIEHSYVSRGAIKLEHAIQAFGINVEKRVCVDVGASTGGFTEVLLNHGAERVLALDVGHNQIDWKIRSNPKVKVIEGYNVRHLNKKDLEEWGFLNFQFLVIDVSFISLSLIFSEIGNLIEPGIEMVTLIKPQFEVGRENLEKGGIVRNEKIRIEATQRVVSDLSSLGFKLLGLIESPIKGTEGNVEYLAHWRKKQ